MNAIRSSRTAFWMGAVVGRSSVQRPPLAHTGHAQGRGHLRPPLAHFLDRHGRPAALGSARVSVARGRRLGILLESRVKEGRIFEAKVLGDATCGDMGRDAVSRARTAPERKAASRPRAWPAPPRRPGRPWLGSPSIPRRAVHRSRPPAPQAGAGRPPARR
jgi:hypothetical protein